MRTTLNIPDAIYEQLKTKAAMRKTTVEDLLIQGAILALLEEPVEEKRAQLPFIRSHRKDKMTLTHPEIYKHAGLS